MLSMAFTSSATYRSIDWQFPSPTACLETGVLSSTAEPANVILSTLQPAVARPHTLSIPKVHGQFAKNRLLLRDRLCVLDPWPHYSTKVQARQLNAKCRQGTSIEIALGSFGLAQGLHSGHDASRFHYQIVARPHHCEYSACQLSS
jgi:hypothetical protein